MKILMIFVFTCFASQTIAQSNQEKLKDLEMRVSNLQQIADGFPIWRVQYDERTEDPASYFDKIRGLRREISEFSFYFHILIKQSSADWFGLEELRNLKNITQKFFEL